MRVWTITRGSDRSHSHGAMQHAPVVPDDEIARLPLVPVRARRLHGGREQVGEQCVRLARIESRDGMRMPSDEQRGPLRHRMHLHQRTELVRLGHAVTELGREPGLGL